MRNQLVSWPLGHCVSSRTTASLPGPQHPPRTQHPTTTTQIRAISPRTQHPTRIQHPPRTQHLPQDHSIPPGSQHFPQDSASPKDHSIPPQDQQCREVAGNLLSLTDTPQGPTDTSQKCAEETLAGGGPTAPRGAGSGRVVGTRPRGWGRQGAQGHGWAGERCQGPGAGGQAGRGAVCVVWERCLRKPVGFTGLHAKSPSQKGPVCGDRMPVAQPHLFGQQSLVD